jgi:hypothetical protein
MATTTNFGWATPDNTAFVKDGALAIRTLGSAVDASLANYPTSGNKIINGDFRIAQRGTSFSSPVDGTYTLDRWFLAFNGTGATRTVSQQTFTPGAAPVAGYEGANFIRIDQTVAGSGNTFVDIRQRIEDVRTFAGQTVTISFFAKASANQGALFITDQNFGAGGSAVVFNALPSKNITLTTSWQRFTHTGTVASISGKTIGTGSSLNVQIRITGGSTFTVDIFGVQIEAGSVASPFQTASGSIAGELALAQRYYTRLNYTNANAVVCGGQSASTTQLYGTPIAFPVQMRVIPSAAVSALTHFTAFKFSPSGLLISSAVTLNVAINSVAFYPMTVATGLVADDSVTVTANTTSAFIEMSAEL